MPLPRPLAHALHAAAYHPVHTHTHLQSRFGGADGVWLSEVFNLAFPIGGLLAALPASALLRHAGTRPHLYWGVTAGPDRPVGKRRLGGATVAPQLAGPRWPPGAAPGADPPG